MFYLRDHNPVNQTYNWIFEAEYRLTRRPGTLAQHKTN